MNRFLQGTGLGSLGMPGDEAIGADQQRAVRLEAMRGGRHHFSTSQLHTEAIYIHRERYATLLHHTLRSRDPRRAIGAGKQAARSAVRTGLDGGKISRLPKVTSTWGARVPGSPAIAPLGGATARCPLRRAEYGRRRAVYW
jgi:hypothetical protein